MRLLLAVLASIVFIGWSLPAAADDQWQEFRSPERGFAAMFPATPTVSSTPIKGQNPLTQYEFRAQDLSGAYEIAVAELNSGKGPSNPDAAFFTRLVNLYADGSSTKVRTEQSTTIAGHSGMEAVLDDNSSDIHHLLDVTVVGDRIYLIASAGPKGHETSAGAKRFRDSFQLINQ